MASLETRNGRFRIVLRLGGQKLSNRMTIGIFWAAARAMQRILVENARRKKA